MCDETSININHSENNLNESKKVINSQSDRNDETFDLNNIENDLTDINKDNSEHCYESYQKFYEDMVIKQRNLTDSFPSTVTVLEKPCGSKVYIVGTAHFSEESISEVKSVISRTIPDYVMVELCKNRSNLLHMDDEAFKNKFQSLSLMEMIKTKGTSQGIMTYLLMKLNDHLVDQIKMNPGGEFRAAFQAAREMPNTIVVLGDRRIDITLKRALGSLGLWGRLKFTYAVLNSLRPITKEDVEKMKQSDILEQLVGEVAKEFPSLARVIIDERDQYLTRSIWELARPITLTVEDGLDNSRHSDDDDDNVGQDGDDKVRHVNGDINSSHNDVGQEGDNNRRQGTIIPSVTVAVVGIGHVPGIVKLWSDAHNINNRLLDQIEEPPLSWTLFVKFAKISLLTSLSLMTYKLCRMIYARIF